MEPVCWTSNRLFYVQVHPSTDRAQLPAIFESQYGRRLSTRVRLEDPKTTSFNVDIQREAGTLFISPGMIQLQNFYQLIDGGWLKMFYMGGSIFHFEVQDSFMKEVTYPHNPLSFELSWSGTCPTNDGYASDIDIMDLDSYAYDEIKLTESQITNCNRALPTNFVSDAFLPRMPHCCVLRDQQRRRYYCDLVWSSRRVGECYLKTGWRKFIKENNLKNGNHIFIWAHKMDPAIIHVGLLD